MAPFPSTDWQNEAFHCYFKLLGIYSMLISYLYFPVCMCLSLFPCTFYLLGYIIIFLISLYQFIVH